MQKVRRLWALMFVYLLGAFTYSIGKEVLLIIVIPTILLIFMLHDEKSYRKNIRTKGRN
ncbi:MAG: hypothetical protein RR494_04515 [Vagococcus sp.]|uniref:hypothetical protein n=1 Tax=Vagococcus sp. TaxID=1933889 RepID=UPI002FCB2715